GHASELRLRCENGALYQERSGKQFLGRLSVKGPLYFSACAFGTRLDASQHLVRSMNLWNEFFEEAP
ncbi:unnamed protein product, partial [marine sediment metagenome]